jgi:hypothetical protein
MVTAVLPALVTKVWLPTKIPPSCEFLPFTSQIGDPDLLDNVLVLFGHNTVN